MTNAGGPSRDAEDIDSGRRQIAPVRNGTFRVGSFTGNARYTVHLKGERQCDCPDAQYRGMETCEQVAAVLLMKGLSGRAEGA